MSEETPQSLKEQKQDFVTGHSGTSPWELLLVCCSAPLGIWLFQLLATSKKNNNISILVARNKGAAILLEAMVVLFPMALSQTSLLYPYGVAVMSLEFFTACWLYYYHQQQQQQQGQVRVGVEEQDETTTTTKSRLDFVTCYRSSVCFLTFVAILAVDFHVFPRRFAKTETTGYGLMDLGAGSFVVAAGLVSKGSSSKLKWKRMIPLLTMGAIRFFTNKAVEYQEHVSEYGRHWNFFFTLAVITPLASLLRTKNPWLQWIIPITMLVGYQLALTQYGLQEYVEKAPRDCEIEPYYYDLVCDAFAANREGILGSIGYTALFLLSEQVGRVCLWNVDNVDTYLQGKRLMIATACLWLLHWFLTLTVEVSRRTTNMTFCIWTLAHNILVLTMLQGAMSDTTRIPPIFQAVNRHGLLVFIVANLFTGVVNLSMNTLDASDQLALFVVFSYLCVVGGFALLLDSILMPRIYNLFSKTKLE